MDGNVGIEITFVTVETLFRRKMSFVEHYCGQLRNKLWSFVEMLRSFEEILRSFEEMLLFLMEAKCAENHFDLSQTIKKA